MSDGARADAAVRKHIVLDTDPGIDDAMAIFYLAAAPEAEIVAVSAVHGNVPASLAADNALRLLDLVGLSHVPVAVGARTPFNQAPETSQFVHGEDGLGGAAGPPSARRPIGESGAEQLVRLARHRPAELSLLALGPLTNIALALRLEPELPSLLREVVWMGGAIGGPGNMTPHAEFNAWGDPEAAEQVLAAGFELTIVPLDATSRVHADTTWMDAVAGYDGQRAQFATRLLEHYAGFYATAMGLQGCLLHDPLAAAILLDPALAITSEEHQTAVELTGAHTRGMTVTDLRRHSQPYGYDREPVRIVLEADTQRMLDRLSQAVRL
jgi:purine nucleosidase